MIFLNQKLKYETYREQTFAFNNANEYIADTSGGELLLLLIFLSFKNVVELMSIISTLLAFLSSFLTF